MRRVSDRQRQGVSEKSNFLQTCNLLSQYLKEKGSLRDLNIEIGGKVESLEAIVKPGSSLSASPSASMNSLRNTGKYVQQSLPMDFVNQTSRPDSTTVVVEDVSIKTSTSKEGTTEPKHPQLTIFYSGRVLVFDDYPADKARELMSIAKKSGSQMSYGILPNTVQEKPRQIPREGLPPRPQYKELVGISSNTCKEKTNTTVTGADTAHSSGLPPLRQSALRKLPLCIASNDSANLTAARVALTTSEVGQKPHSPQSEANGSDLPIARRSSLHRFLEKRKDRAAVRGPYHNPERAASSSKGDEQIDLNL